MSSTPLAKPRAEIGARVMAIQKINGVLADAQRAAKRFADVVTVTSVEQVSTTPIHVVDLPRLHRSSGPSSSMGPGYEKSFAEIFTAIDEVDGDLRLKLEEARSLIRALVAELAEEERLAAEADEAERQRLAFEAKVAAGVRDEKRRQDDELAAKIRAELGIKVGA